MSDNLIEWTPAKLKHFKKAYDEAYETSQDKVNDVFMFEDDIFVLSYAKYLIEYLELIL